MPLLSHGARGAVVRSLQTILTRGAFQWGVSPHGIDGVFGPATAASVRAFQRWAAIPTDGVVGDQSWASSYTLPTPPWKAPPACNSPDHDPR